ncbi:MAG: transcriptional repressor [Solobacterium sp.]|jgi:Fur family ferric uptake transcriptional regulator|nr:transcriptional repressor [Solobacterium sp.]
MRRSGYKTSQKAKLLQYMKEHEGRHLCASDVYHGLAEQGNSIGLTTVYRNLDKLAEDGEVTKYIVDENAPACYVYGDVREHSDCHCRCLSCGQIIHLHCGEVEKLEEHIKAEHGFYVDHRRTVFYGLCESCYAAGVR